MFLELYHAVLEDVNVGRINLRLDGVPFEEVDCFWNLRSQVAVDEGCVGDVVQRMNEG